MAPALNNVGIPAVPEPATWAMVVGGFGVLGKGNAHGAPRVVYSSQSAMLTVSTTL